ncbi:hypothetical protein AOX55_00006504 (plasmid) [Sinorhizobium fredii CCBAU 25509]|nr:hypothetical protein SF83666_b49880 [Sinorhizobium fredii CCBAU 83666]AWM29279.1 hypothetical protein AOX55_00006504 [Sinorhizobium fredii CCBAU 25509]
MFSDIHFTKHIKCNSSLQRSMRTERDQRVQALPVFVEPAGLAGAAGIGRHGR